MFPDRYCFRPPQRQAEFTAGAAGRCAARRKNRSGEAPAAPGWRARPRSGATLSGGQRGAGEPAAVPCWRALDGRCCSMNPSAAWMPACAPGSAAGSLKNWPAVQPFPGDPRDPRSRGTARRTGRCLAMERWQ
ncbi:hypothetical protein LNQ03_08380 [Klebsiella pneumoniae subsp. pneumoniae]|nr:hypothetical protein [Klebsiella pneumoniae subsp. pneumoniae]